MKTRLAIPIFVLISMVILSGCALRRSSEKEAWTESIPSNVNFIVSVRLSELLADQDVVSLVGSLNLVNLLSSAREEIGIDLRQVARLTVFGDLDTDEYFGVLIEGGVEPKLLLTSFEASLNESPSLEGYKGHDVYVFSDDGLALVWLDLDTVLASSSDSEMAHDVIDILEGDANSASGPVIELLGSLGDPWLKASLEAPEELLGDGGQIIPGLDLGLLTDIQLIGLVVDKKQSDFQLEVSLQYPTEKSAEAAVDVLDSLITLVTAFTDDRLASELIDQIEISSAGSTVTVAYSATVDELFIGGRGAAGFTRGDTVRV